MLFSTRVNQVIGLKRCINYINSWLTVRKEPPPTQKYYRLMALCFKLRHCKSKKENIPCSIKINPPTQLFLWFLGKLISTKLKWFSRHQIMWGTLEVAFWKCSAKLTGKYLCWDLLSTKLPRTLSKSTSSCFPENFVKFLEHLLR